MDKTRSMFAVIYLEREKWKGEGGWSSDLRDLCGIA